jgi:hypothetical protein
MGRRFVESIGVAVAFAAIIFLLHLAPVAGQAPPPKVEGGAAAAAMLPWGEPDLQGIWTRDSDTPLQRPAKYANREFFTDQERAEIDSQIIGAVSREADPDRRKQAGIVDVGGAYNASVYTSHLKLGKRTSMVVDPPDGRLPALTADEQARRKAFRAFQLALLEPSDVCRLKMQACVGGTYKPLAKTVRDIKAPYYLSGGQGGIGSGAGIISRSDGPEDRGLSERCMSAALPDFGGFRRIVQSPGQVSIFYDTGQGQGWIRSVPITNAPHLPANVKQWWGDSRAKWDGKTLVVDVTNFSEKSNFNGAHDHLHLIERWTRINADTIEYAVTVEDPTVWVRPWTAKQELKRQSDKENRIYTEPRCHEGNYGMGSLLAGAREDETLWRAGKAPIPDRKCLGACGGFAGGFSDDGDDTNPLN